MIITMAANHVKTRDDAYPFFNNEILNGIIANKGKKLKKFNADLPNTKFTIVERLIGSVNNGFTLITGNFCRKNRINISPINQ